jgi:hypothetical protein
MHTILTQTAAAATTATTATTTTTTTTTTTNGIHKRHELKMKHSNYCNKILKYIGIQHISKYSISKLFMCNMSRQGSNRWYDAITLFKTSVNVVLKFTTSRGNIRWNISCVAMLN